GSDHTVRLHTGDRVMVAVWVRYAVDVSAPIYGLTIKTPDGITVYGSNSRDFPDGPVMQPARAGELVRVVFQIDLRIGAGDFLMSLGVAHDVGGGEIEPLDRRYDSILIHVSRQSRCYGLADFDMRVEIKGNE
ncbi:MAG: Wzt carbohydrate-binding domain-containing protein, partial [Lautropia sp.]|nr:Wzt carbohydrate-binding domain-containing protein [Lautropia sp.]